MSDNIFEKLTAEEQKHLWMYMIFNKDKITAKTEQWTKKAEEASMTLTEYLESISPLNNKTESREETRWIPVSKMPPKDNGQYQCTVIINDLRRTMELFYKNGKWLDNRRIDMFDTYDIYGYGYIKEKHKLSYQELISEFDWTENVIAWKLLPEPYRAESEDKE